MSLINRIFNKNPYEDFNENLEVDLQGWGTNTSFLNQLIDEIKPTLIIEVGSWKRVSAIDMGKYIRKVKLGCEILCVDTWLGSIEHMNYPPVKNGYPQIYFQFLKNVIAHNLCDIIVPFPNTSSIAAQWLYKHNITPNLVYLDGSHNEEDVLYDIEHYYELIDHGILCGDDYKWIGVEYAVNTFCNRKNLKFELLNDGVLWLIRK